ELAARRHLQLGILVTQRLEQEALARLARRHDRTALAALEQIRPAVQPQLALDLLAGVALVAVLDEQRTDLLLEELPFLRRLRPGVPRQRHEQERRAGQLLHGDQAVSLSPLSALSLGTAS